MANITTVIWTGKSGAQYSFQQDPIGANYYAYPGVYIFAKLAGQYWNPIYIGETTSFKQRLTDGLAQHHRLDCIRQQGATHIFTLRITGSDQARTGVETDLRNNYNPPCNRQ